MGAKLESAVTLHHRHATCYALSPPPLRLNLYAPCPHHSRANLVLPTVVMQFGRGWRTMLLVWVNSIMAHRGRTCLTIWPRTACALPLDVWQIGNARVVAKKQPCSAWTELGCGPPFRLSARWQSQM